MSAQATETFAAGLVMLAVSAITAAYTMGEARGKAQVRDSYNEKYQCITSRLVQGTPECVAFVLKGWQR